MKNGLSDVNHPRYFTSGLFLRMAPKKGGFVEKVLIERGVHLGKMSSTVPLI